LESRKKRVNQAILETQGRSMAVSRLLSTVSSFVLSVAFALQGASAQNASKIGVASAVKNRVDGTIGGGTRPLVPGSDIFAREVVRTGEQSTAQLLFLDETSLSIGPASEITLDRFVYDPNRGAGNVVLNATKGAFRFVSGSQQPSSYQIRTPVATIGVRGTIFDLLIALNAYKQWVVVLILVQGALTAANHTLTKAGQALVFHKGGVQQVTWDSTLFAVVQNVPFPLFGNNWAQLPWITQLPGSAADRFDQTYGTGGPPPPDPCNF
jgi:hypothetical protein